jgi:hypothetical protein
MEEAQWALLEQKGKKLVPNGLVLEKNFSPLTLLSDHKGCLQYNGLRSYPYHLIRVMPAKGNEHAK